jgi:hypothetical protein
MRVEFMENAAGVHVVVCDYTLCGYATDAAETETTGDVEGGAMRPVEPTWVSCPQCAAIIMALRPIRTKRKR